MKKYFLSILLIVIMLHNLFAKIMNGYEKNVENVRLSIKHLRQLISDNPQFTKKHMRQLNIQIRGLTDFLVYHQLTDTLLHKFRMIAPDLYAEIDTLKDHLARNVDVYVKFVPGHKSKFESYGLTTLAVSDDDERVCISEYGRGTVAVTIWIMNSSLVILSHEFGHLKYIVPNLASYVRYYNKTYAVGFNNGSRGHRCDDVGGRNAIRFETRYRQRYHRYLRQDDNGQVYPFVYVSQARKSLGFPVKTGGN